MSNLQKIVETALVSYNETNSPMNLVLFEDALIHVARINRILESPRGRETELKVLTKREKHECI